MKTIHKIYTISILLLLIITFFTVLPFIFGLLNEPQKYFFFNNYKQTTIILSEFTCTGTGGTHTCFGESTKFPKLKIGRMRLWDRREMAGNGKLQDEFEKNKGRMQIWYNPNSNKAYFSENYLKKFDFITVWKGDLIRLFFNLILLVNTVFWYKLFEKKARIAGLSVNDFLKLKKENRLDEYLKEIKDE